MPPQKPKMPKGPANLKAAAAPAPQNLPAPQSVPKAQVGTVVQDFINFGGATAVEAHQDNGDTWLVTATA